MKKLLHIIATPRGDDSRTLQVSRAYLGAFAEQHPSATIQELNLFRHSLPAITAERVSGKLTLLGGKNLPDELRGPWYKIEDEIRTFLSADVYLVTVPMWNFSIPYPLKHYIDIIVQPRYLFHYTPAGPEGLARSKKMIIVTSRGGNYAPDSPAAAFDHQEPYLRTIFNFVGIKDIRFIHIQPADAGGSEIREQKIEEAKRQAQSLAGKVTSYAGSH